MIDLVWPVVLSWKRVCRTAVSQAASPKHLLTQRVCRTPTSQAAFLKHLLTGGVCRTPISQAASLKHLLTQQLPAQKRGESFYQEDSNVTSFMTCPIIFAQVFHNDLTNISQQASLIRNPSSLPTNTSGVPVHWSRR